MNETPEVCRSYKWSYIWSSNSWVRYVSQNDRVRCCANDVTMYQRCDTNIILYDRKMGRIWRECNYRLINFINNFLCLHFLQICLNWSLIPVWCTCIVKISDNFIYCHFRFVSVSDVIDCFKHLSIHSVNFKYVTTTNIKRCDDLLCWCLIKQTIKILVKINTCFENNTIDKQSIPDLNVHTKLSQNV